MTTQHRFSGSLDRSSKEAWAGLAVLGLILATSASGAAPRAAAEALAGGQGPAAPSPAARAWAWQVLETQDHRGLPFIVVDKRAAMVVLHAADGRVTASSTALLGSQPGDHSEPGVGERTQSGTLRPGDMTTPAGRFPARPGYNRSGDAVLWLNEDEALALHRLRPGRLHALRARALAAPDPAGRRLSAGCVVVPSDFFDRVVTPLFAPAGGIVYVLPEHGQWPQSLHAARFARH